MSKKNYVTRTVYNYEVTGAEVTMIDNNPVIGEEVKVNITSTSELTDSEISINFQVESKLKQVVIKEIKFKKTTYRMEFDKFIKEAEIFVRPKSQRKD